VGGGAQLFVSVVAEHVVEGGEENYAYPPCRSQCDECWFLSAAMG
jgi:hypothetical protein